MVMVAVTETAVAKYNNDTKQHITNCIILQWWHQWRQEVIATWSWQCCFNAQQVVTAMTGNNIIATLTGMMATALHAALQHQFSGCHAGSGDQERHLGEF